MSLNFTTKGLLRKRVSSKSRKFGTFTSKFFFFYDDLEIQVSSFKVCLLPASEKVRTTGFTGYPPIKRCLSSLEHVINALVRRQEDPTRQRHIPYRDSVITRLLQVNTTFLSFFLGKPRRRPLHSFGCLSWRESD